MSFFILQVVKLLLANQCEVNSADRHRATPLFLAVSCGSVELFELLISNGAYSGQVSRYRLTPLMLSIIKGHTHLVIRLINLEGTFRKPGILGLSSHLPEKSFFQLAVQRGNLPIVRVLVAAGCDLTTESYWLYNQDICGKYADMTSYLQELTTKPLTLAHWCRTSIRRYINKNVESSINQLESYPRYLKDFILLKQFQEL